MGRNSMSACRPTATSVTITLVGILLLMYQFYIREGMTKTDMLHIERTLNEQNLLLKSSKLVDAVFNNEAGKTDRWVRKNRGIAMYSDAIMQKISALTSRKAQSRDPELISLVREIMDPPTDGKYKPSRHLTRTPQAVEVEAILHEKKEGFFVECGGLDGERSSNTVYLEQQRQWTGLLIEADPHYYTQLLGKSRRSWSINACLSPYDYVSELPFHGDSGGRGNIGMTANNKAKVTVPCFPFETLMLALNRTHIDYFSLDVEGVEFPIIKTIPFDRFTFDVLSVEYGHDMVRKNETAKFMDNKGFYVHKDIHFAIPADSLYVEDFIFVRKTLQVPPKNASASA